MELLQEPCFPRKSCLETNHHVISLCTKGNSVHSRASYSVGYLYASDQKWESYSKRVSLDMLKDLLEQGRGRLDVRRFSSGNPADSKVVISDASHLSVDQAY